jgi:hypothetical protein
VTISQPFFLVLLLVYCRMRRGAQWDALIIGAMFGASLGASSVGAGILSQLNDAAYSLGQAALAAAGEAIARLMGNGGPKATPASGLVALRYNLALVGIGR